MEKLENLGFKLIKEDEDIFYCNEEKGIGFNISNLKDNTKFIQLMFTEQNTKEEIEQTYDLIIEYIKEKGR